MSKTLFYVTEEDGIYINITAHADGGDAPIRFAVCGGGVESEVVTYRSTPSLTASKIEIKDFGEKAVTSGIPAATTYSILNRYGEDITLRTQQPTCGISLPSIVTSAVAGAGERTGILTVVGENPGTAEITLSMPGDPSVNAKVNVTVLAKACVQEIRFGTATAKGLKLGDEDILYIPVEAYD